MLSLFRYLVRNYPLLLFIALEVISLILLFNFNNYQQVKYLNSANRISGAVYEKISTVFGYFDLHKVNQKLASENARLKTELESVKTEKHEINPFFRTDINSGISNKYISARAINYSVNKAYNYITLNKGRRHGIKTDQGIVCATGVVGVVAYVSDSYSLGLSVLNPRWEISAKLKNTGNFGPLSWKGDDYRYAYLKEIPLHLVVNVGDTIVTSGHSTVFPEGVLIGTVNSVDKPSGESNYEIKVKLSTDFVNLTYVDIINNENREEIELLQNRVKEDEKPGR